MKNLTMLISLSILLGSVGAFAAPISCGIKTSEFRVHVNSHHKTAQVTKNGEVLQFGNLVCQSDVSDGTPGEVFLSCRTPNVADVGFNAVFKYGSGVQAFVNLGEVWIGGERPIANLPCVIAQH